jgi:hypothetical protein
VHEAGDVVAGGQLGVGEGGVRGSGGHASSLAQPVDDGPDPGRRPPDRALSPTTACP